MSDSNASLSCQMGCWITAAGAGLLAAVIMMVVGDISVVGSIFLGLVLAVVLGVVLNWLLCKPLPTLAEVQEPAGPSVAGSSGSGAGSAGDSDEAPAEVPPIGSAASIDERAEAATEMPSEVAPIGAGAAAEERASSAGEGGPAPIGAAAAADTAVSATGADAGEDYDKDGVVEGSDEGARPPTLDAPMGGKADNLKEIKGVGPKLEKMLNGMGIYHFDQVASWGDQELAWVDANIAGFKGRASRDDWVGQAKILASGGDTEFSKRVDEGDVY